MHTGPFLYGYPSPGLGKKQMIFSKGIFEKSPMTFGDVYPWGLFTHVCVQLKKKKKKDNKRCDLCMVGGQKQNGWYLGSTSKRESEKRGCYEGDSGYPVLRSFIFLSSHPSIFLSAASHLPDTNKNQSARKST